MPKRGGTAEIRAIQERVATIGARLSVILSEIQAAKRATITEQDVPSALEAFGPVWEALWPVERTRVLGLLAERVGYDGRNGTLAVSIRPNGSGAAATDRNA